MPAAWDYCGIATRSHSLFASAAATSMIEPPNDDRAETILPYEIVVRV